MVSGKNIRHEKKKNNDVLLPGIRFLTLVNDNYSSKKLAITEGKKIRKKERERERKKKERKKVPTMKRKEKKYITVLIFGRRAGLSVTRNKNAN